MNMNEETRSEEISTEEKQNGYKSIGRIFRSQGGLRRSFLTMTLFPVLLMGVLVIAVSGYAYRNGLYREVRNDLYNVAQSALSYYDIMYPGDYNLLLDEKDGKMYLRKGDAIISGDTVLIDQIKKRTGVDLTLFFYDTRLMTTIVDSKGNRVNGTIVHAEVARQTLSDKQESFFASVHIDGTETRYFAQYIPLFGSDGTCIGMVGAAKPSAEVADDINELVFRMMGIIALIVLITMSIIHHFTNNIVEVLRKMMHFLKEVSDGNLHTEPDPVIVSRDDEIGDMGRFTMHVRTSLRRLIEKDSLTGLYNRRRAEELLGVTQENASLERSDYYMAIGDIDFFKSVNDNYGHAAGDVVLVEVARVMQDIVAGKGYAARWGGEEFLLIFDRATPELAKDLLEQIRQAVEETTFTAYEQQIHVTMSFGAVVCGPEEEVRNNLKLADDKLYRAKDEGRNRIISE